MEKPYCPSCGREVDRLVDSTGWCAPCTIIEYPEFKICTTCGDLFPKRAQVDKCWSCRKEARLAKHADAIESLMAAGHSFTSAQQEVADSVRPVCQNCDEPIRGGRTGTKFCSKNAECRKASRDYRRLRQTGLTPDVALAIATRRVTVLVSK